MANLGHEAISFLRVNERETATGKCELKNKKKRRKGKMLRETKEKEREGERKEESRKHTE